MIYIILPVHLISDLPLCKNYVYIYYMVFTTAFISVFLSAQHNCIYYLSILFTFRVESAIMVLGGN